MKRIVYIWLLFPAIAFGQLGAKRVRADTLVSFTPGQYVFVRDSSAFGKQMRLDSIGIPIAPPNASLHLFARGLAGLFIRYANGNVVRLDTNFAGVFVPVGRTLTFVANTPLSVAPTGAQDLSTNRSWTFSVDTSTALTGLLTIHRLADSTSQLRTDLARKSTTLTMTGTSNRLSVSGGTQDLSANRTWTFDIDGAYVGQSSITTLGTITTGTWHGSTITVPYGGTGRTIYAANAIPFYSSGILQSDTGFIWDSTSRAITFPLGPGGLKGHWTASPYATSRVGINDNLWVEKRIWGDEFLALTMGTRSPTTTTLAAAVAAGDSVAKLTSTSGWSADQEMYVDTANQNMDVMDIRRVSNDTLFFSDIFRYSHKSGATVQMNRWRGAVLPISSWNAYNVGGVLWLGAPQTTAEAAIDTPTVSVANHTAFQLNSFTTGSIPFIGTNGTFRQNNSQMFWDSTNHYFSIGSASPGTPLHVEGSSAGATLSLARFKNSGNTVGTGARIILNSLDAGGNNISSTIEGRSTDVTSGAGKNKIVFSNTSGGTLTDNLTIADNGLVTATNKITGLTQASGSTDAVAGGRNINTTAPLTGGGNLTGDLTLVADTSAGNTNLASQAFVKNQTGGVTGLANPSVNVTLSTQNGSATTAMRSDAAPALSQAIVPTWSATHIFQKNILNQGIDSVIGLVNTATNKNIVISSIQKAVDTSSFYDTVSHGTGKHSIGIRGSTGGLTWGIDTSGNEILAGTITLGPDILMSGNGTFSMPSRVANSLCYGDGNHELQAINDVATGQVLTSQGTSATPAWSSSPSITGLTLSGLTLGSVLFAGTGGTVRQDNANFFYDSTNHRLGIGITAPLSLLHTKGGTVILENTSAGATAAPLRVRNIGQTNGTTTRILLSQLDGAGTHNISGGIDYTTTDSTTNNGSADMYFETQSAGTLAEAFRITSGANTKLVGVPSQSHNIALEGEGYPAIHDTVATTGLSTAVTATNLNNTAVNGLYRVTIYLYTTTGSGTATAADTIIYNNGARQVSNGTAINLSTAGSFSVNEAICRVTNSAAIQYSTSTNGTVGSARYEVDVFVERIF